MAKNNKVETLWSRIESVSLADGDDSSNETTTLIVGDGSCGKTSIINNSFKAASTKAPKPTFALEYTFARKKNTGSTNASKCVAHVWELGGGINELKLLTVPLTIRVLPTVSLVVCCDLSKPQNAVASLRRWIDALKEILVKGLGKDAYKRMRENARATHYAECPDKGKVSPFPVPLYVVGTKYDHLRNMTTADRRSVLQLIRFLAHYNGGSFLCSSSTDATMRDTFKPIFGSMCFASGLKNFTETTCDKPIMVSAGKDSFSSILSSTLSASDMKARLVHSEADISTLIGSENESVPRGCWGRLEEHAAAVFGPPDVDSTAGAVDGQGGEIDANDFPEPEIDSKRAEKDAELAKYVQDAERRDALQSRMQEPAQTEALMERRSHEPSAVDRDTEPKRSRPDAESKDQSSRVKTKSALSSEMRNDSEYADLLKADEVIGKSSNRVRK